LFFGLDAFGNDPDGEFASKRKHSLGYDPFGAAIEQALNETPIYLDFGYWKTIDTAQTGVAGTKIVD
jgi:hypothetical protein